MQEIINKLYVVSTPIGNLEELSPRALFILNNVDFIACEDTRNTLKLCAHFKIEKTLISCHEHNELNESNKLIDLIKEGKSIALVSDAGFPGISDPGRVVIDKCIDNDIKVEIISGPCALINALVGSGLDTTHFYFHGFLDHKVSEKRKELETLMNKKETMIFYEAPHRIKETLEVMVQILGNRKACIARELTKIHEEFIRLPLEDLLAKASSEEIKGEMVLIVEGKKEVDQPTVSSFELINEVNKLVEQGYSTKDAIKAVAEEFNISKNSLYNLYHQ